MTRKWTTKYGLAAVLTAVLIISVAMFANPNIIPKQVSAKTSFAVMLTDPPTVPAGTTVLNITYSDIALHVTYVNGTSTWISLGGSGTINSFALVNMTQTIASTTIPTNTTIDKIQFTITGASAEINDQTYNVTILSNTLVLDVVNSQVNQTLSGVLIDFNPTLVQIQSTDANGNLVNYYVLVPSATAVVVNGLDQAQVRVGTIVSIGQNDRTKVSRVVENFSQNLTITSASLAVSGNQTSLSVTLQNTGDITFRIFGLMLEGQFNSTGTPSSFMFPGSTNYPNGSPITNNVPFEINGTSLVPLLGGGVGEQPIQPTANIVNGPMFRLGRTGNFGRIGQGTQPFGSQNGAFDNINGAQAPTYLSLEPGQTITLTFSGVLSLQNGLFAQNLSALTPTVGNSYTISLTGQGFQSFNVVATA